LQPLSPGRLFGPYTNSALKQARLCSWHSSTARSAGRCGLEIGSPRAHSPRHLVHG